MSAFLATHALSDVAFNESSGGLALVSPAWGRGPIATRETYRGSCRLFQLICARSFQLQCPRFVASSLVIGNMSGIAKSKIAFAAPLLLVGSVQNFRGYRIAAGKASGQLAANFATALLPVERFL